MKLKDIPIVPLGPGSQPEESDGQQLSYIDMPNDMATFQRPHVPEPDSVADLDGASKMRKFWHITVPMISPAIFFNMIMSIIGSFQVFTQVYIITGGHTNAGGPNNSTLVYVLYLYRKAFLELEMGYACALAWFLFLVILILSLLIIRSSALWVYYEGERR